MKFRYKIASLMSLSLLFVGVLSLYGPTIAIAKTVETKVAVSAVVDSSIYFQMDKTELSSNPRVIVGTNNNGLGILADDASIKSEISKSSLNYPESQDQRGYKIIATADQPLNRGEISLSAGASNQVGRDVTIVCTGNF